MTGTFFAIRTPVVQTWLSQKIAAYLSDEMGTRVEVGGVEIDLWSRLVLKNLYIEDKEADTLAFIPELRLNKYHLDRSSGLITIDGASLYSPYFRYHLAFYSICIYDIKHDKMNEDSSGNK